MKYLPEPYSLKEGIFNISPIPGYFEEIFLSAQAQICIINFSKINAILDENSTQDILWDQNIY